MSSPHQNQQDRSILQMLLKEQEKEQEDNNKKHQEQKQNSGAQQEIKVMTDTMAQILKENPPALNNFYYIYSLIQEVQGNLIIKISEEYIAWCQLTLPNLTLQMEGTGESPLEALVNLTEKLRPIVDKFVEDKKSMNPCNVM